MNIVITVWNFILKCTLLVLATYHVFKNVNRFIELEPRDNL